MASATYLAELQANASCPICLDHLRDPVTTECGHNFCPSCIHKRWEGLQDTFPCPVCLHHCPDRSLKRNLQICRMTEIVQQISTSGSQRKLQEEIPLCGKHNEALTLFCEQNMELLCAQCKVLADHQDGPVIPIKEVAAIHRSMLKGHIGALTNYLQNAKSEYKSQHVKTLEVTREIEKWRNEVDDECKNLKCTLKREHDEMNDNIFLEKTEVEVELNRNRSQILDHMFRLNNLLSEIEEKYLQTDPDLLTDIDSIHKNYKNIEAPAIFSRELRKDTFYLPPHYFGLHKMIRKFYVELTLDPETAHPSLILLTNGKYMMYMTSFGYHNPHGLTSYPAVLSSEGFDAGRHFWQVEARGIGEWSFGVCKESFPRNNLISPSPGNGCWTHTLGPLPITHRKIGIFLDYELGEVSFYDLNNYSYMHRMTATFTGKLMPYFSIAASSGNLKTDIIRIY